MASSPWSTCDTAQFRRPAQAERGSEVDILCEVAAGLITLLELSVEI